MTTSTPSELMSVAEYANHVSVTQATVRRWIRRGYLPAQRVGPKLWRIDPDGALPDMPNGERGTHPTRGRLR